MMHMRRSLTLLAVLAGILSIAGCGSSHAAKVAPRAPVASISGRFCSGLTDRCVVVPRSLTFTLQSARGRIPDVSSFQGHPNWGLAKAAGVAGGIFKGGEWVIDPDASYNATQLQRFGLWHAMYWFDRPSGCAHEAQQTISAAHQFRVRVVINDLEVPQVAGYGACLVSAERKAGLTPVDYTAPGTWPGGAGFGLAPLWQAEYGPTLHPFWHPVLAWQCTDGRFGCVTFVPGIGTDDVSLDLGITKLGVSRTPSAFATYFNAGFQRGFILRWDELHHRRVPALRSTLRHTPVWQFGFRTGWRDA